MGSEFINKRQSQLCHQTGSELIRHYYMGSDPADLTVQR